MRLGSNRKLRVREGGRWRGERGGGKGRGRGVGAGEGVRVEEQGSKLCPSSNRRPYHRLTSYSQSENEAQLNKMLVVLNIPSIEERQSADV